MKKAYLPNGQECALVDQIGDRFIVNKVIGIYHNGDWTEEILGDDVVVDKVYFEKPVEKIAEEVKELLSVKENLNKEIRVLQTEKLGLKTEISGMGRTIVEQGKFIINKTSIINAKTLALFPKDSVMPITWAQGKESFWGLKVNMYVEIGKNEERAWGYKLEYDYSPSSEYLYPDNGILVDPTPEEIEARIAKRLTEQKWEAHKLLNIDDKYLSEEQKASKYTYIKEQEEKTKANTVKRIADLQKELAVLEGKASPEGDLPYPG
jgi:hypothetical protein